MEWSQSPRRAAELGHGWRQAWEGGREGQTRVKLWASQSALSFLSMPGVGLGVMLWCKEFCMSCWSPQQS